MPRAPRRIAMRAAGAPRVPDDAITPADYMMVGDVVGMVTYQLCLPSCTWTIPHGHLECAICHERWHIALRCFDGHVGRVLLEHGRTHRAAAGASPGGRR